ncbi:hypothetical protein TrLO_g9388 [Triparma laevis f. longispina]|uniref:Uncharacterized protein n=1 Tax=Triparma laevis f. longispina TaxID=1714387 RepID=A0A9W7KZZ3_9STRA|nr:hypothetical protein TrLO_g9388 [Triparma laevis f. longispina]
MNITDMTHDGATQLPLFASLPPLATLCFGVSCLLLSLLLILLTVRHHTKRYLLPVSSLQSALSSNRVTHCNAEIKSCSAHDPFLNLSFATTHLRRKVHTYGFIKSTYREFYLFNKRATNAEKSLMATKEGNGDSRVRVHWTVGWKEGAGEGQDVVVPPSHIITTGSPIQLSNSTQIIPDSLTPPPPSFTPIPPSMLPPHSKFETTETGYTTVTKLPRIGDIKISYEIGLTPNEPITLIGSKIDEPTSDDILGIEFKVTPGETSPLLHERKSIHSAISSAINSPIHDWTGGSTDEEGEQIPSIGSFKLAGVSGLILQRGTVGPNKAIRREYKRKTWKWWVKIFFACGLSLVGGLCGVGILRESFEVMEEEGEVEGDDILNGLYEIVGGAVIENPWGWSLYVAVMAVVAGFAFGQMTVGRCAGGWASFALLLFGGWAVLTG